jgi:glycosyltransferase involved in cell wall biosynthesis
MWVMPNVYPGWASRLSAAPLVISPHGTLSRWALEHSRWKKRAVWALLQGPVVRAAACLHATADAEYHEFREFGIRQPVCIIPHGIDVPEAPGDPDERPRSPRPSRARRTPSGRAHAVEHTILFLGRLHVKKGIDQLLHAWAVIARERPSWEVRIVGPDDGAEADLRSLAASLGLPRLTFAGPAFGPDKWDEYRRAAVCVLPTHSENFGLTVAEALAAGTPAITTRGAPWSGLVRERCGLWIEHGLDPLVTALREVTALEPDELAAWGARGRAWILRDYSWDTVVEQMGRVYTWLRAGGPMPSSVRLD